MVPRTGSGVGHGSPLLRLSCPVWTQKYRVITSWGDEQRSKRKPTSLSFSRDPKPKKKKLSVFLLVSTEQKPVPRRKKQQRQEQAHPDPLGSLRSIRCLVASAHHADPPEEGAAGYEATGPDDGVVHEILAPQDRDVGLGETLPTQRLSLGLSMEDPNSRLDTPVVGGLKTRREPLAT